MDQIAAKLASLVPQPRDELGAEKGRETGEARRRTLERSTVEVKGAGGILVIGGLLAAAAVAAGATIIARRAQAKRPPASKKERIEGFNGDHKSEQNQIDGSVTSVGIPEDNRVSVKSKDNLFEDDTCNGAKDLPNAKVLDMDQVNEKNCRKVDLGLQNGIVEEIRSNGECQKVELREQVENILEKPVSDVVDETPGEEENEAASPGEAEHSVNHHETELNGCVPALGDEEKEDEPLPKQPQFDFAETDNGQSNTNELIQSADLEISKQECQCARNRNEKVFTFLEEPKQSQLEMAECKSDVSRAVEPLSFKEIVEQQKVEASQSDLAEEAKSLDISEQQIEQVSDEYKREKEDNLEKYADEVEEKKVHESSPEAEHGGNHHETELNECAPALGDRNEKVFTFLEEPKQSQLEMAECKSDVSRAVESLYFKEIVEQQKVEASQSDLAEESKSQDINEQQIEQVLDEYKREKEDNHEKYEDEVEEKKVPELSPEAAAEEEMKEKKEAESSPQQEEGEEENKSSYEVEEIEEMKEAESSPEGKEHEEEKEDKKDIDTPHDEKDEHEDEEVTEGKKEVELSLEGEGDGIHNNQTQPHIIHSEVSTEEFSTTKETDEAIEKRQLASFAQEEDGSNNNQIQTNIADPQHSAEEQCIVNEIEKIGEERQESDSSPVQAAQISDVGSDSARVSSAESNEAAIAPLEVVEQAEILLHEVESKILSDSLRTSGELKDEVHVSEAEESIICRDKIPDNLVHANKAEEKEKQSIIGREKTTENIVPQQLMGLIREKALVLEKLLMDIPDRLLVAFLLMALTIVLLHYTKPLSRLHHIISPSGDNLQEN